MIVEIDMAGARLAEPDDFTAFKVRCGVDPGQIARLLPHARVETDHAWIDPAWIAAEGRASVPAWRAGLARMIDYAARSGWVDERGAIRAHIERMDP